MSSPRALVVGTDADVSATLHRYLRGVGFILHCAPAPEFVEPMLQAVMPRLVIFLHPEPMSATWERALSVTGSSTQAHVTVVMRSRAAMPAHSQSIHVTLLRDEVLSQPSRVLQKPPRPASSVLVPPPPAPSPKVDLMTLIEDELEEPITGEEVSESRLEVDVSLVSENTFYVGDTKTLESGGLYVAGDAPQLGAEIDLSLGLASGRRVFLRGVVAWRREASDGPLGHRRGYGLRLIELPVWALEEITRFMAARPPLTHVEDRFT